MAEINYTFDMGRGRPAVHTIEMTVPKASWEALFGKLEKFGKKNEFEAYIRRVKKDVDLFFIDLWRADIAISGSNAVDLEKYDLSFYIDPDKGGTVETVTELTFELEEAISDVPDLKLTPQ